jgi:nitroimidazol reductase NimA-like FMN-containing flavoprotein (pyridoxamine 5'-phosphate oxidase superfamily)
MDVRELISANRYMVLATADATGRPWISPVWFAPDDGGFLWVSRPDSRHSRNLAERPELPGEDRRAPIDAAIPTR